MRTNRALAITVLPLALAGLTACGSSKADSTSSAAPVEKVSFPAGTTMAKIAAAKTLRIGVKFDHPLLSQRNLKGDLEGFEAEMTRYIAGQLGIAPDKITYIEASGANREQFLQQDKVDMVVATMSITDKRKKVIGFAGPYLTVRQDLMVPKGNPKGLKSPQDPAGTKICSTLGGAVSDVTRKTYPKVNLVEFDVSSKCVEAIGTNAVDALATQDLIGYSYVAKDPEKLQMLGAPYGKESWGIGIAKGDKQFCEFLNTALAKFASSGSYKKAWEGSLGKYGAPEQSLPQPAGCA